MIKRTWRYIIVLSPLLLGACDQVRGSLPRSDDKNARYELQRDDQGRMVRLDKVTGEVAILKGESPIALTSTNERARPGIEERLPVASTPAKASGVTQQPGAPRAAQISVRSGAPEVAPPGTPQLVAGSRVTIIRPSPVYLRASENQTPLEVLGTGAVGTVLRTEGEWYLIAFESPRWGRRVGFLKSTAVDYGQQPLDLSVPETLEPLDLSVPDPIEPLDLSVPDAQ